MLTGTRTAEECDSSRSYGYAVKMENKETKVYELFPSEDKGNQRYYSGQTLNVFRHLDAYRETLQKNVNSGLVKKIEKLKESIESIVDDSRDTRIVVKSSFSPELFTSIVESIWNGGPKKDCSAYIREVSE